MFTALHHVASPELQNRLFHQVHRVLRPDGLFVGTDSAETTARWLLHEGDTYVPVDPSALAPRLHNAGFVEIVVEEVTDRFRFLARRARLASRVSPYSNRTDGPPDQGTRGTSQARVG
jgi:SAM-dependent methyltransferase